MSPKILLIAGAAILVVLGSIHLAYTFFSTKFFPRDAGVADAMKSTSMRITRETTMWRAWIGFHASHSLGVIVFGVFLLALAALRMDVIVAAPLFAWIAVIHGLALLAIAKAYWFRIPLAGIAIASACFLVAAVELSLP